MKDMNKYLRYGLTYLAGFVILTIIIASLAYFAGINAGSGTSLILPMVMGMQVGQWSFEEQQVQNSSGERWGDALRFGALGFAISIVCGVIVLLAIGGSVMLAMMGPVGLLLVLVIGFVLSVLATRIGIWLGNSNAAKAKARLASK